MNGSRVWVNDAFAGRFEVFVFGGRNTLFSWSQMALVAPLESVQGGVDKLVLDAGVGNGVAQQDNGSQTGPPFTGGAGRQAVADGGVLVMVVGMMLALVVL